MFKNLNHFKKHTKNQEVSSILKVVFALSKSPHLHRELSNRPGMSVSHCITTNFGALKRYNITFRTKSHKRYTKFHVKYPAPGLYLWQIKRFFRQLTIYCGRFLSERRTNVFNLDKLSGKTLLHRHDNFDKK